MCHRKQRTQQDELEILSELRKGHFLKDLNISPEAQTEFCRCLVLQVVEKTGTQIVQEGEEGQKCFVILSGSVSVETEDAGKIKTLNRTDAFGVQILRNEGRYAAHYSAQDVPLVLLTVSRWDFERRIGPSNARDLEVKEREYRSISALMRWKRTFRGSPSARS